MQLSGSIALPSERQKTRRLGVEEPPDLWRRQDLHLLILAPRPLRVLGRVDIEVAPLDRVLEHLLEHHHDVKDCLRREFLGQQGFHELPHVRQRDRVEPHLPKNGTTCSRIRNRSTGACSLLVEA
jgi:hypothetical protein